MSNLYDYDSQNKSVILAETETKKPSKFKTLATAMGTGAMAMALTTPAHAAILDLSELTTEMESIKTAILGVIAVAVAIGIAIVGWRWAKRGLFSI